MADWHWRLWRRVKLAPGVTVNLSKSGPSVSVGPRGAKVTFGHGRVRQTLGVPGTGVYVTKVTPSSHSPASAPQYVPTTAAAASAIDAEMAPDQAELPELHFGWPLVIAVGAGVLVGLSGAGSWQAVDVAAVAWVTSLAYEWVAHHHPGAARVLVHLAIATAAIVATLATLLVAIGLGAVFAGAKANRRRR